MKICFEYYYICTKLEQMFGFSLKPSLACDILFTHRGENGKRKEKTAWDLLAETVDVNVTAAENALLAKRVSSAEDAEKVLTIARRTATCFTTFFACGVL